jgi:hypothetical protein
MSQNSHIAMIFYYYTFFSFSGTSKRASTVSCNANGSQTVKFVLEIDNGSWDAYLDYFTVSGDGSNSTGGTVVTTPTPNSTGKFHCFLLLGQSNMAGYLKAQAADKVEGLRRLQFWS